VNLKLPKGRHGKVEEVPSLQEGEGSEDRLSSESYCDVFKLKLQS
jgi:hypothetical protein